MLELDMDEKESWMVLPYCDMQMTKEMKNKGKKRREDSDD